ncbi:aspartate/glutamate racemase family protein [Mahella australiensis]|uniref:Asp/Glu/hydantoin racemase n=1 Tax=Mahella australiensis (strain DSM 15567 / CIP 107919 / 50-1 BON) TaxID=697281 RepID=F4A2E5_MAHA5|nr:aspartate/glutamate racemase family protein [Mahella australiensis]AEE97211.1 Asp/Glu/hydantoin racemase [Mahella australiensis 50-1 BON]
MSKKLAIIHTSFATVEPLTALAKDTIEGCEVVNFMDDSILPQLMRNGGDLSAVEGRWLQYVVFAKDVGAACVLNACSSVGELTEKARRMVSIPVIRIDEAMAEKAVGIARRIGVAATLPTTLRPTLALLEKKSREAGKDIELQSALAEGAYEQLVAGHKDMHDAILTKTLKELADKVDIVVLAQASMARVIPSLSEGIQDKFLSSPVLAMQRVKAVLDIQSLKTEEENYN